MFRIFQPSKGSCVCRRLEVDGDDPDVHHDDLARRQNRLHGRRQGRRRRLHGKYTKLVRFFLISVGTINDHSFFCSFQDIKLKDLIFVPEVYTYELLKFESPEVLKKSESLTMTSTSNVR